VKIPSQSLDSINIDQLAAMGYRYVMLDIDNTLTKWRQSDLTEQAVRLLLQLKQYNFKVCLVSNGRSERAETMAQALGILYVSKAYKPLKSGYHRALKLMQASPEHTVMIGDQILTDFWGARRMKIKAILVDPISRREALLTKMNRIIERRLFNRSL